MLFGAHVSIAGGIEMAIERGTKIGATCIQTFASPPRTLHFTPFSDASVARYASLRRQSPIELHVFHAVYLVNLGSEKPDYVKASMESLIQYQRAADSIEAVGTIFHVGSHKGAGFEAVKRQVGEAIAEVVKESPSSVQLILENAAGHKGTIGQTLEELAELISLASDLGAPLSQLGICLDTQHAFACGVDAKDAKGFEDFLTRVRQLFGKSMVKVIHLNDSKVACNSRKDRHANLGDGEIGQYGIAPWLHHPLLTGVPYILEVPGQDGKGPGIADMQVLKDIYAAATV